MSSSSSTQSALENTYVIIPMLNEQDSIQLVLDDLPAVARVIVVDNGSTDNSPEIARQCGAQVISEPQRGYGKACLTGIAEVTHLLESDGELAANAIIAFVDGDYSDHPEELEHLVEPIGKGEFDFVVGSRSRGQREAGAMHFQAIFGNWLACTLMRIFWGAKFSDLGPFRAIRYETLKDLEMKDQNFGWTIENADQGRPTEMQNQGNPRFLSTSHWCQQDQWNNFGYDKSRLQDSVHHFQVSPWVRIDREDQQMLANQSWTTAILISFLLPGFHLIERDAFARPANSRQQEQKSPTGDKSSARRPSALLKVADLKKQLSRKNLRILELGSKPKAYEKAHIEGAQFVHWIRDITDPGKSERYNIIDQKAFEKLMQRLGITRKSHLVLYDDMCSRLSTRMYWTLKYYGHDNVQILDGGKGLWARSEKMTNSKVVFPRTKYAAGKIRTDIKIDMKTLAASLASRSFQLLDGRMPEQYSGEKPGKVFHTGKPHRKKGHIPGAINICWKENFNQDGTFKSPDELKKLYKQRGIASDRPTVTYCNEGLHAAPPWFVMTELLKARDVKLYDDSMCEWANSEKPVVKVRK